MYYFDNRTLQQYLDSGQEVGIFVNSEYLTIADMSDISNPKRGVGYDEFGEANYFSYPAIEKIKVGNGYLTLDGLQKQKSGEGAKPEDSKEAAPEEEPEMDAPSADTPPDGGEEEPPTDGEEEPKSKEKEPDLAWYSPVYMLGHQLLKEWSEQQHDKKRNIDKGIRTTNGKK